MTAWQVSKGPGGDPAASEGHFAKPVSSEPGNEGENR